MDLGPISNLIHFEHMKWHAAGPTQPLFVIFVPGLKPSCQRSYNILLRIILFFQSNVTKASIICFGMKECQRNRFTFNVDTNFNAHFIAYIVKVRSYQNSIKFLWDENGVKVEEADQIKHVAESYYQTLAARMEQLVPHILLREETEELIKPVAADEIKRAIFSMNSFKLESCLERLS